MRKLRKTINNQKKEKICSRVIANNQTCAQALITTQQSHKWRIYATHAKPIANYNLLLFFFSSLYNSQFLFYVPEWC